MVIIVFIILAYCILLVFLWMGWERSLLRKPAGHTGTETMISIIVPVRNEATTVKRVIHHILDQRYRNFELILVNDHSEDQTVSEIQQVKSKNLLLLLNEGQGKKWAITTGIKAAKGSIIVTTDADCTMPSGWLRIINN